MISPNATPEIREKMKIHSQQKVKCLRCGRIYWLTDLSPQLYIDIDIRKFRPPDKGGNGYNYNCPHCKILIYAPRW